MNELLERANYIKRKIDSMSDEDRERFVSSVIDWIVGMFDEIRAAMENGGALKAARVAKKYRDELKDLDKKATVIVCLTYAIKEKYQEKLAPLFIGVLGLV